MTLWEELSNIKSAHHNLAWCFYGDFNAVRNESERKEVSVRGNQKNEIRDLTSLLRGYIWRMARNTLGSKKRVIQRAH